MNNSPSSAPAVASRRIASARSWSRWVSHGEKASSAMRSASPVLDVGQSAASCRDGFACRLLPNMILESPDTTGLPVIAEGADAAEKPCQERELDMRFATILSGLGATLSSSLIAGAAVAQDGITGLEIVGAPHAKGV